MHDRHWLSISSLNHIIESFFHLSFGFYQRCVYDRWTTTLQWFSYGYQSSWSKSTVQVLYAGTVQMLFECNNICHWCMKATNQLVLLHFKPQRIIWTIFGWFPRCHCLRRLPVLSPLPPTPPQVYLCSYLNLRHPNMMRTSSICQKIRWLLRPLNRILRATLHPRIQRNRHLRSQRWLFLEYSHSCAVECMNSSALLSILFGWMLDVQWNILSWTQGKGRTSQWPSFFFLFSLREYVHMYVLSVIVIIIAFLILFVFLCVNRISHMSKIPVTHAQIAFVCATVCKKPKQSVTIPLCGGCLPLQLCLARTIGNNVSVPISSEVLWLQHLPVKGQSLRRRIQWWRLFVWTSICNHGWNAVW